MYDCQKFPLGISFDRYEKVRIESFLRKIILIAGIIVFFTSIWVYYLVQSSQEKVMTVGIARWVDDSAYDKNIKGFKEGLALFGYIEGKNIQFIVENPEANKTKQKEIIEGFVDRKVDLIYSLTTPGTIIAKETTNNVPIVFSIVTYPVETGVIDSLDSSGNNLVGTRNYIPVVNQLEMFHEIIPVKKIGFVHRYGEPNSVIQYNKMKSYASEFGIDVVEIAPKTLADASNVISDKIDDVDALYQACDTLIQSGGEKIAIEIAMAHDKPTFSCNKEGVEEGSLFGDVVDFKNIGYLAGEKAALILGGGKPSEIITETQRNDFIAINLVTAQKLGIKIPEHIMEIANEVIR